MCGQILIPNSDFFLFLAITIFATVPEKQSSSNTAH